MRRILGITLAVTLMQLALFAAGSLVAGTIARSTKAGSTTSFAESFALGNILAVADLDTDIDTAYSTINGGIDGTNIFDGSIGSADLGVASVGTAELQLSSVTTSRIADGAVTAIKVTPSANVATASCTTNLSINTTPTTVASVTLTATGGAVSLVCDCGLAVSLGGTGVASGNITLVWKRDATTIGGKIFSPITFAGGPGAILPMPCSDMIDTPTAGAHTYTITAQTDQTALRVVTPGLAGSVYASESKL